ncbi:hypothetical protein [Rhizobium sp. KDH_Rht_773_N]
MSAYLQIAETILRTARRPLSARSIMRKAFLAGIVPDHLYGQAQHKTLQARLSEDILHRRDHSAFYRTMPGQFFLREFLTDASVPAKYRREMTARRRTRELFRGPALSVDIGALSRAMESAPYADAEGVLRQMRSEGWYNYIDPKKVDGQHALLWAVSALTRNGKILCYRMGRYRDDRDSFAHKRTIGFSTLVLETDQTLFDTAHLGIADSGLLAVATDLDIPLAEHAPTSRAFQHSVRFLAWCNESPKPEVLAFVEISAPDWFEPPVNKLSFHDASWLDLASPPNNIDDFDPWSKTLLNAYFGFETSHAQ